jgi:hypothetical protein
LRRLIPVSPCGNADEAIFLVNRTWTGDTRDRRRIVAPASHSAG